MITRKPTVTQAQSLRQHLTDTPDTHKASTRGMAFFAGTGPEDRTCADCVFHGYAYPIFDNGFVVGEKKSQGCLKFYRLRGKHGPAIAGTLYACKYFQPKAEAEASE